MRVLLPLLVLTGCGPGLFQNSAPRLLSVNSVDVNRLTGIQTGDPRLHYTPGETFELELEIKDQEGHDVSVWWPNSPRGWRFPSDETEGEWQVPPADALLDWQFIVVLEDNHRTSPLTASYYVPLWTDELPSDSGL